MAFACHCIPGSMTNNRPIPAARVCQDRISVHRNPSTAAQVKALEGKAADLEAELQAAIGRAEEAEWAVGDLRDELGELDDMRRRLHEAREQAAEANVQCLFVVASYNLPNILCATGALDEFCGQAELIHWLAHQRLLQTDFAVLSGRNHNKASDFRLLPIRPKFNNNSMDHSPRQRINSARARTSVEVSNAPYVLSCAGGGARGRAHGGQRGAGGAKCEGGGRPGGAREGCGPRRGAGGPQGTPHGRNSSLAGF
eukprot:scaffold387129_cov34-Prasinocladus_malaysianus.AAC.1